MKDGAEGTDRRALRRSAIVVSVRYMLGKKTVSVQRNDEW